VHTACDLSFSVKSEESSQGLASHIHFKGTILVTVLYGDVVVVFASFVSTYICLIQLFTCNTTMRMSPSCPDFTRSSLS